MTMLDSLLLLLATGCSLGYVGRADGLNIWEHRLAYLGLHLGLFGASFIAGVHAWTGAAGLQDWLSVLGSGCWLVVSYHSWHQGVPDHVRRHPVT